MQLEFLGHAGFIITQGNTRVACDPWLSSRGAFHASWFQFPCNHHLWQRDYCDLTAVVLTHEHPDHLDADFLTHKLPPGIPVVIPLHSSRNLRQAIRNACANPIVEVKPGTDHSVGEGVRVLFTPGDTPDSHGSAATFRTREAVVINMSTALLTLKKQQALKDRVGGVGGRIDAVLVRCAGVNWHPLCYRYSDERIAALATGKRVAHLEEAYKTLDRLAPRIGLPCIGPPAFLEDSLFRHNDDLGGKSLVPDQKRSQDWLRQRGYGRRLEIPLPGDRLNLINGEFIPDQRIRQEFSFDRTDMYLKAYAERTRPAITAYLAGLPQPTGDLFESFRAHVQRLGESHESVRNQIEMEFRFVVEGRHAGDFLVRCHAGELTVESTEGQSAPFTVRMDAVWLNQIMNHNLPWRDFFLSLRFSVEHNPEVKDDHMSSWLKLADVQGSAEPASAIPTENPAHA